MDEGFVLPDRILNSLIIWLTDDEGPCQLPVGVGISNSDVLGGAVLGDALGAAFTAES